jgi:hypothetical protein
MRKFPVLFAFLWAACALSQDQQPAQAWTGTVSDNMCGASHQMRAAAGKWTDRECVFECIKALGKYVLVDEKQQIIAIANQDAAGLPLYTARKVRITGKLKDGAIIATKVEGLK